MRKPNILIYMLDHGRGDLYREGSPAATPHADRLAREGVSFARARCTAPHCCPSRASFFTGEYPTAHGVWNNVDVPNTLSIGLNEGVKTFSEKLRESGYRLFYSGKWHVSRTEDAADRGFERVFPHNVHTSDKPADPQLFWSGGGSGGGSADGERSRFRLQGGVIRPGYPDFSLYGINENPFKDRQVVDAAVAKLEELPEDEPWCLYAGVLGPHDPYKIPQRYLDMYREREVELPPSFNDDMLDKPNLYRRTRDAFSQLTEEEHREALRHFYGFATYLDDLLGEILHVLDRRGDRDDTMVVFTSDHGDYMAEHGLWAQGLPSFRGAYDIPLIVRWPNGIVNPGRSVDDYVSITDFAPTFLEAAGADPAGMPMRAARSLVPYLKNEAAEPREFVFSQSNGNEIYGMQRIVWGRKYKYALNCFDYDELYDLEEDPHEMNNLAGDKRYRGVVEEMMKAYWRFAKENSEQYTNGYIMTAMAPVGPMSAL